MRNPSEFKAVYDLKIVKEARKAHRARRIGNPRPPNRERRNKKSVYSWRSIFEDANPEVTCLMSNRVNGRKPTSLARGLSQRSRRSQRGGKAGEKLGKS
jgi:hypothetical protein